MKELKESGWRVINIPKYVNESNEAQIATGTPHNLGTATVPTLPPCLKSTESLSPAEVWIPNCTLVARLRLVLAVQHSMQEQMWIDQ